MLTNHEVEELIHKVLKGYLADSPSYKISALTPDASLRRYFRLEFEQPLPRLEKSSILAMRFDSLASPESEDGANIPADRSYLELATLLAAQGVAVPAVYHVNQEAGIFLLEDCGDRRLVDCFKDSSAEVEKYFNLALDELVKLQNIPADTRHFAFVRRFNARVYRLEMQEVLDYALAPEQERARALYQNFIADFAEGLEGLPQTLVHRDYHAWNLLIDREDKLRVIDFQDALLGGRLYDLATLLNDRDMDALLGEPLYNSLVERFKDMLGAPETYYQEFYQLRLQKDLKVVGRFNKLVKLRSLKQYAVWIPGTARRVLKGLEWLAENSAEAESALQAKHLHACLQDLGWAEGGIP